MLGGGLTVVGARDVAACETLAERHALLGSLLTMRCLLAVPAIATGVMYAWVAGWAGAQIAGAGLVGFGLSLVNVQASILLPLTIDLRMGVITAIEVLRQAVWLACVLAVSLAGGGLVAFFAAQIVVGLAAIACLPWLRGSGVQTHPSLDLPRLRATFASIAPLAIAVIVGVIYVRAVMLLTAQLANDVQTGYFAASFRAFESIWAVPTLLLSVALPVLSVASGEDRQRLAYAIKLMTEAAAILGILGALIIGFAARSLIVILAGPAFAGGTTAMQIQSTALIGLFVGQTFQVALLAMRAQQRLIVANGIALGVMIPLGIVLIPRYGAEGSAIVAVAGETILMGALWLAVRQTDRTVAPSLLALWRTLPALALAVLAGLLIRDHPLPAAITAACVFLVTALLTRAVPREVLRALAAFGPKRRPEA